MVGSSASHDSSGTSSASSTMVRSMRASERIDWMLRRRPRKMNWLPVVLLRR
jgi:hypothetical protein